MRENEGAAAHQERSVALKIEAAGQREKGVDCIQCLFRVQFLAHRRTEMRSTEKRSSALPHSILADQSFVTYSMSLRRKVIDLTASWKCPSKPMTRQRPKPKPKVDVELLEPTLGSSPLGLSARACSQN